MKIKQKLLTQAVILGVTVSLSLGSSSFAAEQISADKMKEYQKNSQHFAKDLVDKMDDKELIGQVIMMDFRQFGENKESTEDVTVLPKELKNVIHDYAIGSVVLFRENLITTSQSYKLIEDIQHSRFKLPLFIGVDQEGGYVTRLRQGTEMPGNMALAATRNTDFAKGAGEVHSSELSALGFNINFAPVLDVNVNQKNPVIGVRSYGSNLDLINSMSTAYINGLHKYHILSSVKHFPGHGNVAVDSHIGLPSVPYSEKEWREIDLVPFKHAIKNNVDSIMTAHVLLPALDNTKVKSKKDGQEIYLPATLSKKIITGVLRNELKYNGLILTDALEMGAISDNFGQNEAVEMAILAGVDIAVMPVKITKLEDITKLQDLYSYLLSKMKSNPELKKRIQESAFRVVESKLRNGIFIHKTTEKNADKIVGSEKNKNFEKKVAQNAITLIKNEKVLPYLLNTKNRILVISDENNRNLIMKNELENIDKQLSDVSISVETSAFLLAGKEETPMDLENKVNQSDFVILVTYNLRGKAEAAQKVIDLANRLSKPLVLIAGSNPYDIAYLNDVKANIAVYGITGFDITNANRNSLEANIRAGIRSLFTLKNKQKAASNFISPKGKLSVDIYTEDGKEILYPYGHGLKY